MNKKSQYLKIIITMIILIVTQARASYANEAGNDHYNVAIWGSDVVGEWQFNAIAKEFDFDVSYTYYSDINDVLGAVISGKADFATDITYTKAREQLIYLSSPTNIEYTFFFSKNITIQHATSVAVPVNTVFYHEIHDRNLGVKTIDYTNTNEAISLLNQNEVDGIIGTLAQLKPMLESGFKTQLLNNSMSVLPVSIASSKQISPELTEKFVDFLHTEQMQRELNEYLTNYRLNIVKQYLNEETKKLGMKQIPILIKLEERDLFFEYDGEHKKGIAFDIIKESCQLLGLDCLIPNTQNENWDDMYQELLDDKIDLLGAMLLSKERTQKLYFTEPFYNAEQVLIKRDGYKMNVFSNISELISERIGLIEDDYYEEYIKHILPNKKLTFYKDSDHLIKGLIKNEVDYITLERLEFYDIMLHSNKFLPIQIDETIGSFHQSPLAFGITKTPKGKKLVSLLNQAFNEVDIKKIQQKHLSKPDWKIILNAEHKIKKAIMIILIFFVIIVSIVIYYLHRQATTDPLTRLKNRRYLYFRHRSGLKPNQILVYLDIDRFKQINDNLGHEIGDKALTTLSKKIKKHWKGQAYRMGGDEFVLISNASLQQIEQRLAPIASFTILNSNKKPIQINTSYGLFYRKNKKVNLDQAIQFADKKMYKAKGQRYQTEQQEL